MKAISAVVLAAATAISAVSLTGATLPNDDQTITHVLNRVAFGPRAGDIDRVRALGLERYIDEQLHPDRLPDAGMAARLAHFETIGMSSREIAEKIERPFVEARRDQKQNADAAGDAPKAPNPLQQRANSVVVELGEQKILRAVYSERQLQEVLTDFWFNHFNVDARKGRDRFLLTEYERETIRPRVLGRFRDLLGATAKSPAMLFYLDNWMSADPNGPHPVASTARVQRGPFGRRFAMPRPARPAPQGKNARRGLNENYARELMELHTLGVDGGYTQQDVVNVARALTGWTIAGPRRPDAGQFVFNPRMHDRGEKVVLGHRIKAGGGMEDGEQVLDILASHPSTAKFIATALVRRFVADQPPASLVARAAETFRRTGGDLREVMRTILTSPEFFAPEAYRAKVKTPFEFVVSALRATDADVQQPFPLERTLQQLGMPLYQCQPPTGYKDTADAWVNTGALVGRMNFAVQLASGRLPSVALGDPLPDRNQTDADTAVALFLSDDASDGTRATIHKATSAAQVVALALGSPEFQRR
jgi:uncharacterized protein (DUF1800 family)